MRVLLGGSSETYKNASIKRGRRSSMSSSPTITSLYCQVGTFGSQIPTFDDALRAAAGPRRTMRAMCVSSCSSDGRGHTLCAHYCETVARRRYTRSSEKSESGGVFYCMQSPSLPSAAPVCDRMKFVFINPVPMPPLLLAHPLRQAHVGPRATGPHCLSLAP